MYLLLKEEMEMYDKFYLCVGSELNPPWWTPTVSLMGEQAMSGELEGLEDSAVLVRLGAKINLACVKKSQGCNYTETEGQRDAGLFATAWTLLLSESENGICLPQRKEDCSAFLSLNMSIRCSLWTPLSFY